MKQIINKEDKAVSPIIATILLIAITVVLAATLYTVLGGFTKGLSSGSPTASATLTGTGPNYVLTFSSASNVSMSSLALQISNGSNPVQSVSLAGTYLSGSATFQTGAKATPAVQNTYYSITVTGANGGYLSSTTTITINGYYNGSKQTPTNNQYDNNTVTAISIADKTTNTTLLGNTTPSPSIIVAQAVFRND